MSGVARFDCYPSDFLNGMVGLPSDAIAAYTILMMLQYDRGEPVLYVGREHEISVRTGLPRGRLAKAIDHLIAVGKMVLVDGTRLENFRVSTDLERRKRDIAEMRRALGDEWRLMRKQVFERDNYTCKYCGQKDGLLEIDHVVPRSRNGGDDIDNLVTACFPCNRAKGAKTLEEWRQ